MRCEILISGIAFFSMCFTECNFPEILIGILQKLKWGLHWQISLGKSGFHFTGGLLRAFDVPVCV